MNKKAIKVLSLFSGIGAPEQALKNIGVDHELIGFSEIDKYAISSYCKVHDVSDDLNLGDITKIDPHKQMVTINVDMFGRETPVEISFTEIKKMDF